MNLIQSFKHYARIFWVQIKNNYVREAIYRSNFITSLIVDLIWFGIEFALFGVIYQHTDTLGGWTRDQTYFFLGVFFSSDALFTIFFQRNFWNFSDLVNKGELDILLTKPISPLFMALTRYISISSIFNFAMGIGICITYAKGAGFPGGIHWLLVPVWLSVGVIAALLLRFIFSIWVFWTERGFALARLYYQFFTFATKPETLYPKTIRYIMLTILPFALIGSLPARALMQGLKLEEYIVLIAVLLGFYFLNRMLWRQGLKRYQSASS